MELHDAIFSRRSVRAFVGDPIPRATLERLIEAAVQAPTGMNKQPWAFGVIEGAARLKGFSDRAKEHLRQRLDRPAEFNTRRHMFEDPNVDLTHGAPAMIVIYARPVGLTPTEDCSMAALSLMLAARDLGLGSCWIGFLTFLLNQPEVKRELGVPESYRVVAPIALGRPAAEMPPVPRTAPEMVYWLG